MKEFGLKPDPWWRKNSTLRKKPQKKQFTFWPYQPPEQIATILHLMSSTCKLHYWANKHKYYQSSASMHKQFGFNSKRIVLQKKYCWSCWVVGYENRCQKYFGIACMRPTNSCWPKMNHVPSTKQIHHIPILNYHNTHMHVPLLLYAFIVTLGHYLPFPWDQQTFLPSVSEDSGWNKWNVIWDNELYSALPPVLLFIKWCNPPVSIIRVRLPLIISLNLIFHF